MLKRFTLLMILVTLSIGLAACGELAPPAKPSEEPKAEASKAAPAAEGPYYEVTKDDLTSHPDFTSRNIKVLGVKIGDTTAEMEKAFGKPTKPASLVENGYLAFYQENALGVSIFKMTGKVDRLELLQSFAGRIADPKIKAILSSGDVKQMREVFGMEESMIEKADEMGTEYLYDARGIRFIKYKNGIFGMRFSELKK